MANTIDQVVRAANAEAGYKTLHKYILFLHFAFDALYKLKRDNVILTFTYQLFPVTNRRITLTPDILEVGQIASPLGVFVAQFVADSFLSLDPAATPSPDAITLGSPTHIKYRRDRANNVIIFDQDVPGGNAYLEVIKRVDAPTTQTIVDDAAILPMKSYIHFRHARFKFGAASAEARQAEQEYLDEVDEALAGLSDLTPQGLIYAMLHKNDTVSRYHLPV